MIDSADKLETYLPTLRAATWVALDTEADSLHAYPEKICLIQVSTSVGDRLIDPLARLDMDAFLETLSGHELIIHGADYDLRMLRKCHEFVPSAIFDTMLAARLLGARQFSLSDLVGTYLGVKLEKGAQKANWALRPLTERMERYARNDTRYLKPLADHLRRELEAKGRLGWHQETCARLIIDSAKNGPPDEDSVWRVKGSHLLDRLGLALLRELWRWREAEALNANRPPFFVMSHDSLVTLAAASAASRPLEPLLPKHLSDRRRAGVLKAVAHARTLGPERLPRILRPVSRRPNDAERRRFLELQRRRDAQATQLGLDPTVIASRAVLSNLAHDWEKHAAGLMEWQRALLA